MESKRWGVGVPLWTSRKKTERLPKGNMGREVGRYGQIPGLAGRPQRCAEGGRTVSGVSSLSQGFWFTGETRRWQSFWP